jgi:hypothetical protein
VVEGGGWAKGQSESEKFQSLFVAEMMGQLGYSVVNVGPSDVLYGVDTLRETAKKAGFKLVSSNILKKSTGKPIFDPFVIQKIAGYRVAFLGVVGENETLTSATNEADDFAIAPVEETLTKLVPQVRKQADLVVLFGHVGNRTAQKLADEIKGIDVTVCGGDQLVNSKPYEVGNPDIGYSLVCSAGDQGKYIGALMLVLNEKGKVLRYTHEMHGLDSNVPDDSLMKIRVDAFKVQQREVRKKEAVEQVVGSQTEGPHEKFVGGNVCGRCHEAALKAWESSAHAHSLAALEGKQMENSSECLRCHVTGHEDPTGYVLNKTDLGTVSCEQCHGHGTMHGEPGFIAKPTAESCMACHDKKNSPKFDYASYWKKIAH